MSRPYTVFMLLKATPHWLALSHDERQAFHDRLSMQVFDRFPEVRLRCYDAGAFHGRCTDVALWETTDLPQYYFAVDALRDTEFFGKPYFEVVDVITGVEDGWQAHEALPFAAAAL